MAATIEPRETESVLIDSREEMEELLRHMIRTAITEGLMETEEMMQMVAEIGLSETLQRGLAGDMMSTEVH